ncbi:MAG: HAD family hydrolase [Kiritimatiellae bacterium]|nr:HAD family hydrolase [Kiritimatiellia bacterium]
MKNEKTLRHIIRQRSASFAIEPADFPARLDAIPRVRAVLFDVYGTLVSSASGDIGAARLEAFADAAREALEALGLSIRPSRAAAIADRLIELIRREHTRMNAQGFPWPEVDIREIWAGALDDPAGSPISLTPPDIERLATEFECRTNPVWPMEGAREILALLRRAGVALGIVSNAQFYTPLTLEALFDCRLADLGFDQELCSWSYRQRVAKPDITLFSAPLIVLAERGIAPEQILYIGNDMLNDITPAHQSGCRTTLFAGDRRSLRLRTDLPDTGRIRPDAVITHWNQMSRVLPNLPKNP